ncbi:winged helix-turn-helix transcriptional regulator [Levilactobacillus bambusae]|uniref:MarR family transcriptional regulator n=1 Tax=Levilactobacillus bambusae TaxID=2024736 RepID=A0A2V1MYG3_9LACO|nr:helix-turn-helix domain-containing protein [Levilactobacillus bambusae]PWG00054.1 MarR family transcriptional regulator [Levilactobacillus bambusae]
MTQREKKFHIGIEVTLNVISGKWKPLILCLIGVGINRNGRLLRAIPEISQKVLTEQLTQLVNDDVLVKHVFAETPPRVEYAFSPHGESLRPLLLGLCDWGERHAETCDNHLTTVQPPAALLNGKEK